MAQRDWADVTFRGWYHWRTRDVHEKLFLIFVFFFVLCGLSNCAPLTRNEHTDSNLAHHNNSLHSEPRLVTSDAVIPIRQRRDVSRRRLHHGAVSTSTTTPSTPTCYDDVASKAYLAGTVFEGKARSKSQVKNGVYNVTFVVQTYFKGGEVGLPARSPVRLQFAEKRRDDDAECPNSGGVVKANIRRGVKYVVFVDRVGPHSYVARGEPAIRSKINVQAVKEVLCQNCVRKPALSGFGDAALRVNEKLRLVCRARGNPQPALHWYKDGVRMHKSPNVRIRHNKRRATLVVHKVAPQDAGVYECRGTSVSGATTRLSAVVTVNNDNATIAWRVPRPCPIHHYCMNEGTCTYYDTVGEMSCSCAEGYKGTRCEEKDVYNRANGSMYRPMSYFCKLGISSSYYC